MQHFQSTATLDIELAGGWLTIWLNRPEARNAISAELAADLTSVLDSASKDETIRGIVLRGRNQVFCAGGDIKMFRDIAAASKEEGRATALKLNLDAAKMARQLSRMPQVTIAVVEGAAMAGGFGLACASDFVITMADAKYGVTEVRIGLVPAQILPYIIRRVGNVATRKLALLAGLIDGVEAHRIGLADFIAKDSEELESTLRRVQQQVLMAPQGALQKTKSLIADAGVMTPDDYIRRGAEVFADCIVSSDGVEGFSAFIEKRKPSWATSK